jgi:thiamine biosynthesis lipoprotein
MAVAERHGRVMASRLHIISVVDDEHGQHGLPLDEAMDAAVLHLEHLERVWSRFVPTSDISRINRLGDVGGVVEVDPATLTLLATMLEGTERTAGRFDPTVLRAVIAEGYDASTTNRAIRTTIAPRGRRSASLYDLVLDPTTNTVTVPPGLVLDPGGIGKGLAADLTVARLLGTGGVEGALVAIGGDLAMAGVPVHPAGWFVDVEHPDPDRGLLCSLAVSGGGVATSSVRSRRWMRGGVERHHQIDPRTAACSTTDLSAVTVVAPAGWLAEVHATAALSVGSDDVIAYLHGHGLSGVAVAETSAGEQVWTTGDLDGVELHGVELRGVELRHPAFELRGGVS